MILYPIYSPQNVGNKDSDPIEIILLNSNADSQQINTNECIIAFKDFGLHSKINTIYITDTVLNLLTIHDRISSVAGILIKSTQSLTQYMLTHLEKFNQIIFWQKDKQLSYDLAKLLNINRCFMIRY
jgi:hypothetical protein